MNLGMRVAEIAFEIPIPTQGLWQSRYGGDPRVLGRTIVVNNETYTITGVMPDTFEPINGNPEIYLSLPDLPPDFRGRFLQAVARLRPGVSVDAARAELAAIAVRMGEEAPDYMLNWGVNVTPLHEHVTGGARRTLLILLGAVSLLLLIACVNVANLFLTRAAARRREMAVRSSLGAGRARLVVHAMAEALVVAVAAGALGLLLAQLALDLALVRLPELALPRVDVVALDMRVFAFGASPVSV
jgi:putative ABC transport system permease protein